MSSPNQFISSFRGSGSLSASRELSVAQNWRRRIRRQFFKARNIEALFRDSLREVQGAVGEISAISTAMGELGRFRRDIIRSLGSVFSERPNAALERDGKVPAKISEFEGIELLLDRTRFPRNHGRFAFLAAVELLRGQSESLQYLALVLSGHRPAISNGKTIASPADLPEVFFKNSSLDAAAQLRRYQDSFDQRVQAIYVSALSDPLTLGVNLREMITWVGLNFVDLRRVEASVSWLLRQRPRTLAAETAALLEGVAIDAAILSREILAGHISAIICLLHLNGIGLNRRTPDVLSRARRTRLYGRLDRGKRTTIGRLRRLPDGMFVRAQGVFTATEYVSVGNSGYFLGRLRDVSGDEVSVVAPRNLVQSGLAKGSLARVSGFYRKDGSSLHSKEHLEIEPLKIAEVYAQDIWKVAFLDLAAPYYHWWPFDLHIGFQPAMATSQESHTDASKIGGPCAALENESKAADAAAKAADAAAAEAAESATWASLAAFFICLFAETPPTAAACVIAAGKATDLIMDWNEARNKQDEARAKAQAAFQAYIDCMFPTTPTGSSGSSGSSGNQGAGDPVGDPGNWDDPEEVPDWVYTFGDDDWSPDTDSTPDPDPPDPPSFSFPDPELPDPDPGDTPKESSLA